MESPWSYTIAEFRLANPEADDAAPWLDLTLRKQGALRRLRFSGVQGVETSPDFWHPHIGLEILDVSHLGWENITVRVECFEGDFLQFWARNVLDLDAIDG